MTLRHNYSISGDSHLRRNSHSEDADKRMNILLYSEAGASPGEVEAMRYPLFWTSCNCCWIAVCYLVSLTEGVEELNSFVGEL